MNLPEINPIEEQAIDTVVSVLNRAKEKLGVRQTLKQLAISRNTFGAKAKLTLSSLKIPLAITSENFLVETIEKKWRLTDTLLYVLNYMGGSRDETSQYYYYEAIFSQPTVTYPIPQATVSVFFRVQDKHVDPAVIRAIPRMLFRIEGQRSEHDVRYVTLTADWILAVLMMKIKLFQRIEGIRLF